MKRSPLNYKKKICSNCNTLQFIFSKGLCLNCDKLVNPDKYKIKLVRNPERQQHYYKLRKEYLNAHPTCEYEGCTSPSQDIHHKTGRIGDNLFKNFMAICRYHHNLIHGH